MVAQGRGGAANKDALISLVLKGSGKSSSTIIVDKGKRPIGVDDKDERPQKKDTINIEDEQPRKKDSDGDDNEDERLRKRDIDDKVDKRIRRGKKRAV